MWEDKVTIAMGDYPPPGAPFTAVRAVDRASLLEMLGKMKAHHGNGGCFEISMPCGFSKKFRENADIPTEDLPCPCGNEGRYLIRYGKE